MLSKYCKIIKKSKKNKSLVEIIIGYLTSVGNRDFPPPQLYYGNIMNLLLFCVLKKRYEFTLNRKTLAKAKGDNLILIIYHSDNLSLSQIQ